ncbi:MAG: TIGR02450 family Trp-rich protein [Methylococcales bacterium]|nr:TIGR02450 family Trp-rich protein [Methylococcales bacterium]
MASNRLKNSHHESNKLLLSKWTAVKPKQKEHHFFIVTKLLLSDMEEIVACELEAVINKNIYEIDWQILKDSSCWLMGWH